MAKIELMPIEWSQTHVEGLFHYLFIQFFHCLQNLCLNKQYTLNPNYPGQLHGLLSPMCTIKKKKQAQTGT